MGWWVNMTIPKPDDLSLFTDGGRGKVMMAARSDPQVHHVGHIK